MVNGGKGWWIQGLCQQNKHPNSMGYKDLEKTTFCDKEFKSALCKIPLESNADKISNTVICLSLCCGYTAWLYPFWWKSEFYKLFL